MNHPVEPTTVPGLNESPSEKEGKFSEGGVLLVGDALASMKAPPKRKGNMRLVTDGSAYSPCLNESPSEKEGK